MLKYNINQQLMISVIMPTYNDEKYICEAIDSILNQTYTNFEFIIINDGSTDKTEEIILSYDDSRIVYVKNEENLQIVKTLNKGIDLAKGKYIARMDADDISVSERFEKQLLFMKKNPEIDICGTWMQILDQADSIWKYPKYHEEIKAQLLFNTPVAHATSMMKRSFFDNLSYSVFSDKAEDYHLWSEAINSKKFENITEVLYLYRWHPNQTCKTSRNIQVTVANSVREVMLERMGMKPTNREMVIHTNFSLLVWNEKNHGELILWLKKLIEQNKEFNYFDENALKKIIGSFWWKMINAQKKYNLKIFYYFMFPTFHFYTKRPSKEYIKLFIKCLIGWKR